MPAPLIVFSGPPCSGKSTVAAELARRSKIPQLQMDTTRQRILPASPHTREDRRTAYRAMHWAAELLLSHGVGVILDAPYGHAEDRAEVVRTALTTGACGFLIECTVTPATAVQRLGGRGPDSIRIDLTPARVDAMVREFVPTRLGLLLDSERLSVEECVALAEQWIEAGRLTDFSRWV